MLDQRVRHLHLVVDPPPATKRRPPLLGIGLIVLGIGVAVTTVLGPLIVGAIDYHVSDAVSDQITGGEIVALLLVAPVAICSGILAIHGRPEAPVLALAPSTFAVYSYIQLGSGGDPALHPGNSEMFFGLHLGLIVLSASIAIASWRTIDPGILPPLGRRALLAIGWLSIAAATFLAVGLHLPHLIDVWKGESRLPSYLEDPQVFWLVKLMDLGVVAPILCVVGICAIRGTPWALEAVYGAVGGLALLGSSAGMAISMQLRGDSEASIIDSIAFGIIALASLGLAVWLYRPLFLARGWHGQIGYEEPTLGRRRA